MLVGWLRQGLCSEVLVMGEVQGLWRSLYGRLQIKEEGMCLVCEVRRLAWL